MSQELQILSQRMRNVNSKETVKDSNFYDGVNQLLKISQLFLQGKNIIKHRFGIVHQVNLEYLARGVFDNEGLLYPDSVVGTDSHTTMINGLGVVGWGVGGIEAESVMLGQCTAMVLPEVIGFKMTG